MLAAILVLTLGLTQPDQTPAPAGGAPPAQHAEAVQPDRLTRWQEDLDFIAAEFPAKHKNAFFRLTREQWDARIAEIRERLPRLSDAEAVLMIRQLVAAVGDGHSNVWIDGESAVPAFRSYPVMCVWLADGVYAAVVPAQQGALAGQRVVRIGDVPIDDALQRVSKLQAYDNDSGRKNLAVQHLREAESLAGLGIVADIDAAAFTLADADGRETTITVAPLAPGADHTIELVQKPSPTEVTATRRPRRAPYGHEVMPESKTLYIWYDTCKDSGDTTVSQFCEQALAALDAGLGASGEPATIERVVVDLRRNGGGNSALLMPLVDGLAKRQQIRGRLFALIGRRTFSSAILNAQHLVSAARCRLVGEPTGGTPNGFGEVKQFRLPHSKLVVQYSTKLFKSARYGDSVKPDIAAEADAASYFDPARDAVLEAAIGAKPE